MKSNITKRFGAVVTATAVALGAGVAIAAPASAHVTVQTYGATATAGGYGHVFLRVPHAEPGKSTVRLDVQIPEGVTAVKPQQVAGWTESVEKSADGKTVTKVIWSGGNLPDTSFADFGISVKFPATPGATLYFKAVQTLNDGATIAWIEIPAAGQNSHSLAKPAASVKLADAPATGGHGSTPSTPSTGGHGSTPSTPSTGGHGSTPSTGMDDNMEDNHASATTGWNGDIIAKVGKTSTKVIADTSTTRAGEKATVKLVKKNGVETTLFTAKLDSRGDITRNVSTKRTGTAAYTIAKGDTIALFVHGKKLAEAKVS
jgi:uncharacterized protein YcnI